MVTDRFRAWRQASSGGRARTHGYFCERPCTRCQVAGELGIFIVSWRKDGRMGQPSSPLRELI